MILPPIEPCDPWPRRTIIYRSGRRPWPEERRMLEPFPPILEMLNQLESNHREIERYLAMIERIQFPLPTAASYVRGRFSDGAVSGREIQIRLSQRLLTPQEICPSIPDINPNQLYARRLIGGKMYRQRVDLMNYAGQVLSFVSGKVGLCMSVVKATRCYTSGEKQNQPIPDWDWRAMQAGEKWEVQGKHWTERVRK